MIKKHETGWVLVVHVYNPSNQEAGQRTDKEAGAGS